MTITVFGGTGFVGKYVVNELAKQGSQVVCPFRSSEEKALPLKQMGDLGQVGGWGRGAVIPPLLRGLVPSAPPGATAGCPQAPTSRRPPARRW